jgi:hypothetical protein
MPNLKWSELTSLQLGRYAEYYAKMEFASYGYEVYTSEVDDHGVDFVVKVPSTAKFYEVQVKSVRDYGYMFISKSKMPNLDAHRLVCHIHFIDNQLPDVFVIPATAWLQPNAVLVERNYDKPGQTSNPEWGISLSKKNYEILFPYRSDIKLKEILSR